MAAMVRDPEGVTVDARGNVYGCVNIRMALEKYEEVTQVI